MGQSSTASIRLGDRSPCKYRATARYHSSTRKPGPFRRRASRVMAMPICLLKTLVFSEFQRFQLFCSACTYQPTPTSNAAPSIGPPGLTSRFVVMHASHHDCLLWLTLFDTTKTTTTTTIVLCCSRYQEKQQAHAYVHALVCYRKLFSSANSFVLTNNI